MSGLFAFFQSLLNLLVSGFQWIGAQVLSIFGALWRAGLVVLDQVLAWVLQLVDFLVLGVVDVCVYVLVFLVGLLPSLPAAPAAVGVLGDALGLANRYLPITEALNLALVWGTVYAGILVYKGVKLLRGGG